MSFRKNINFSEQVKNLRRFLFENDIEVRHFAAKLEIHPRYMSNINVGVHIPGKKIALKIYKLTKGAVKLRDDIDFPDDLTAA